MTYGSATAPTHALNGVDFDLAPGTCAIMGPSGCGKTTLLHCLAGVTRPTAGQVHYGDRDLTRLSDARRTALRRTDFGFVFQSGRLLPELPAEENVALPLLLGGVSRQQAMARARAWLERLGLVAERVRRPGELSGGQVQRVAVARALVTDPTIVFADEPTGSLDQRTGADVMGLLIGAVATAGAALLVVTHDPTVATRCGRIVQLADGRIVGDHHAPSRQRPAPAPTAAPAGPTR